MSSTASARAGPDDRAPAGRRRGRRDRVRRDGSAHDRAPPSPRPSLSPSRAWCRACARHRTPARRTSRSRAGPGMTRLKCSRQRGRHAVPHHVGLRIAVQQQERRPLPAGAREDAARPTCRSIVTQSPDRGRRDRRTCSQLPRRIMTPVPAPPRASRCRGGRSRRASGCGRPPHRRAPAPPPPSCRARETFSTRPPLARMRPPSALVPAWKISTPSTSRRLVEPLDHRALRVAARIAVRRHHHGQRRVVAASAGRSSSACRRTPPAAPARGPTSAAASAPGDSGSPKRTLYSISFGPLSPIISPANSTPLYGAPICLHRPHRRQDDLVHGARGSSRASSPAAGE